MLNGLELLKICKKFANEIMSSNEINYFVIVKRLDLLFYITFLMKFIC